MEFRKYQHIERFGSSQNVGGIEQGICYVFPKIDRLKQLKENGYKLISSMGI